jgi:hypothetical protein
MRTRRARSKAFVKAEDPTGKFDFKNKVKGGGQQPSPHSSIAPPYIFSLVMRKSGFISKLS